MSGIATELKASEASRLTHCDQVGTSEQNYTPENPFISKQDRDLGSPSVTSEASQAEENAENSATVADDHKSLQAQYSKVAFDSEAERHEYRLKRYADAKIRAKRVATYIQHNEPSLVKYINPMRSCGSYLVFRHYPQFDKFRLITGITCDKHLLCPLCAIRRSAKQFYKYKKRVDHVLQNNPNLELVMFTLTIKNRPDLEDAWNHLYKSMKALLQKRRNAKKGKTNTVFSFMDGAVWSYEVTYDAKKKTGWHPHIHGIGLIPRGMDPKRMEAVLKKEWEEITGDSYILKLEYPYSRNDQLKAFAEVFKYALKVTELTIPQQVHVFKILNGRRFTASFGSLYGVKLEEVEPSEQEYAGFMDVIYKFNGHSYEKREVDEFPENHWVRQEITGLDVEKKRQNLNDVNTKSEELKWKKKVEEYLQIQERLKNSKISSRHTLAKKMIGFVLSVKGTLTNGAKTGFLKISKHADHAGMLTGKTTGKIIKRSNPNGKERCKQFAFSDNREVDRCGTHQYKLWDVIQKYNRCSGRE